MTGHRHQSKPKHAHVEVLLTVLLPPFQNQPQHAQVEVRLLLRSGRAVLDPPLEELRLAHYRGALGAFLGLPAKMKVCTPPAPPRAAPLLPTASAGAAVSAHSGPLVLTCFTLITRAAQGVSDLSERAGFFRWVGDSDPAAIAKVRAA